jgi:hypothetical protein
MSATTVLATDAGTYVHWGVISVSVANLVVVGLMILLFVLALVVPFPGHRDDHAAEDRP